MGRNTLLFGLLVTCSVMALGCAIGGSAPITSSHATWNYLGGVSVHRAEYKHGQIRIPVEFHDPQRKREPGFLIERIKWSVGGDEIQFWAYTYTTYGGTGYTGAREIVIDEPLSPGAYRVVYRDPDGTLHPAGAVTIRATKSANIFRGTSDAVFCAVLLLVLLILFIALSARRPAPFESGTTLRLLEYVRHHRQRALKPTAGRFLGVETLGGQHLSHSESDTIQVLLDFIRACRRKATRAA